MQKWCSPAVAGWFTEVIAGPITGPWLVEDTVALGAALPAAPLEVGAKPAGVADLTSAGSTGAGPAGAPASSGVRGEGTFVTGWVCGCG